MHEDFDPSSPSQLAHDVGNDNAADEAVVSVRESAPPARAKPFGAPTAAGSELPSHRWGSCYALGNNPGAIFIDIGRGQREALNLETLMSDDDLAAALDHLAPKRWMTKEIARNLQEALYKIVGVIVRMDVQACPHGGVLLHVHGIDDGGSGITKSVLRPDILAGFRHWWHRGRGSRRS